MRRTVLSTLLVALAAASAVPARAASRPEPEQQKIEYLLGQVKASSATFIRNGKEYPASKAVSYLKGKLFFTGSHVQTAREFVVGVASRSEESKQPYTMRLADGRTLPVHDWLMERLSDYETARGEGSHAAETGAAAAPNP